MSKLKMKSFFAVLFFAIVSGGCISNSRDRTDEQAAYIAGQREAFASISAAQRTSVVVIGPVQNPNVPWTDGLTLAQAIVAANYNGLGNPKEIILMRQGETTRIDPKDLLGGRDVPLQPGDTITIRQ